MESVFFNREQKVLGKLVFMSAHLKMPRMVVEVEYFKGWRKTKQKLIQTPCSWKREESNRQGVFDGNKKDMK